MWGRNWLSYGVRLQGRWSATFVGEGNETGTLVKKTAFSGAHSCISLLWWKTLRPCKMPFFHLQFPLSHTWLHLLTPCKPAHISREDGWVLLQNISIYLQDTVSQSEQSPFSKSQNLHTIDITCWCNLNHFSLPSTTGHYILKICQLLLTYVRSSNCK